MNVTYTGSVAVTNGPEIPVNTSVLNDLTVNNTAGVTLVTGPAVNGFLNIASNAVLDISGSGLVLDSPLTNAGTVNWLGGAIFLNTAWHGTAGPVINLPGAVWSSQCNQSLSDNYLAAANGYFQNEGTLLMTNATGTNTISIPFYNSGTVEAEDGTIMLGYGGTLGGTFSAAANAAVDFGGGTFPLGTAAPQSSGTVQFTYGATFTFSGPMTGVLNCGGGTLGGPMTIATNGILNISGIGMVVDGALTNSGAVNWLGGNIYMGTCGAWPAGQSAGRYLEHSVRADGFVWLLVRQHLLSERRPDAQNKFRRHDHLSLDSCQQHGDNGVLYRNVIAGTRRRTGRDVCGGRRAQPLILTGGTFLSLAPLRLAAAQARCNSRAARTFPSARQ